MSGTPNNYNISKVDWLAISGLTEDHNIIIKPTDKNSNVMVWGQKDWLVETDRYFHENEIHESRSFEDDDSVKLVEKNKSNFQFLKKGNLLLKKNLSVSLINLRRLPVLG